MCLLSFLLALPAEIYLYEVCYAEREGAAGCRVRRGALGELGALGAAPYLRLAGGRRPVSLLKLTPSGAGFL